MRKIKLNIGTRSSPPEGKKECRCCHAIKNIDEFGANKSRKDNKHYYCSECATNRCRVNYERNSNDENFVIKNNEKQKDYYYNRGGRDKCL